jgi:mRNA interferase RelE/StbE
MENDEWTWEFRQSAKDAITNLDSDSQRRITQKLDDIVTDEWREPPEYIEPLTGARHGKIRVGDFRLGAEANYRTETIVVFSIDHRSGAYEPGDD